MMICIKFIQNMQERALRLSYLSQIIYFLKIFYKGREALLIYNEILIKLDFENI